MADNAPFSVSRSPLPNVVIPVGRRVEVDLVTFSLAAGAPTIISGESTAGVAVSTPGTGRVAITVPAALTGTTGFMVVSAPKQAADSDFTYQVLSTSNFATGALELRTLTAGTPTNATSAGITVMVYRIKAVA
jgi:hypothetical protein